MKSMM